jgi:hypothetical protein
MATTPVQASKGGKEVWIQASYNPILDLNGKPFKVVKYATDITKQVLIRMGNERVRGMMESVAAGAEELNASVREISEAMTKSRQSATTAVERVKKMGLLQEILPKVSDIALPVNPRDSGCLQYPKPRRLRRATKSLRANDSCGHQSAPPSQ